jgi:FtsP/CotA-like multicopper oxidase with cupredoxin domain
VAFGNAGTFNFQHVTPGQIYPLAFISVLDAAVESSRSDDFHTLRVNADMVAEHERAARYQDALPDKTLALIAEMDLGEPDAGEPRRYVCPMHSDVISDRPGKCPKCGMKLMPSQHIAVAMAEDMEEHAHRPAIVHEHHDADAMADGIEWEDLMPEVNRTTAPANMRWKLVDRDTGKENADIDWSFRAGDQVKIRLVNEMESDHPMHHPFHVHGERFLVLARNGVQEANVVWKDTVLIRTGETVDILMDGSNPGLWMAHCHIAEHMESGMMFSFRVRAVSG